MSAEKNMREIYVASMAVGHGLMQFFVEHPGMTYVLGDEHYIELSLRTGLSVNSADITSTRDRRVLISDLAKRSDYEGVIPATPSSLEVVTELGMRKIAEGLVVVNISPIPDGTHLDVYK
jgi:hypothetical protein